MRKLINSDWFRVCLKCSCIQYKYNDFNADMDWALYNMNQFQCRYGLGSL